MHDQPINSLPPEPTTAEVSEAAILDQRLVIALETTPTLWIPADFAARVARQLPAPRPVAVTTTHYGDNAILVGILVTLLALVAAVLRSGGHAAFGLVESFLLAEFLALAVWLSVRRYSLR